MVKQTASLAQRIAIHDRLKQLLTKVEGTDLWTYNGDWSDGKLAAEQKCSVHNVSSVRREMFGSLRTPSREEGRIVKIERELSELRVKYHKLVTTLALQKVVDVKHLRLVEFEQLEVQQHLKTVK